MLAEGSYLRYEGSVYRPPSEADSVVLQVMHGCSYGECTFCGMYSDKQFRVRPFAEVKKDIQNLPRVLKARTERVFLADGDALALPGKSMLRILDLLTAELPGLRKVAYYANAHSLLKRSEGELSAIRERGLQMLYLGLESGDEETLRATRKGVTVAQTIEACQKVKRAGFRLSVMAILGLGGAERTREHAHGTGKALSAIDPDYISLLTLLPAPGAALVEQIEQGNFALPGPEEALGEMREIIVTTEVTQAVFRTTHASNYLGIEGTLPKDKAAMLEVLDHALADGGRGWLRPEALRRF